MNLFQFSIRKACLVCFSATLLLFACSKEAANESQQLPVTQGIRDSSARQLDIGWDELIKTARLQTMVNHDAGTRGYIATASGYGTIYSGEYAGKNYTVYLRLTYSGIGSNTLTSGYASVKIGADRLLSVTSPDFGTFQSFCCGEGSIWRSDGQWVFNVYGQLRHTSYGLAHQHLFAAMVSSRGLMNMNIADQSGTITSNWKMSHDPGVGLLTNVKATPVQVRSY